MSSIIYKVTELDKEMRLKVKELEVKREKLPEFLRDHKKELIKEQEKRAHEQILSRKQEIEKALKGAKNGAIKELKDNITKIEKSYKKNKDLWIDKIYNQCIEDYLGD